MNMPSIEMALWLNGFTIAAMLARRPRLAVFTRWFMRLAAWYSLTTKHGQQKKECE